MGYTSISTKYSIGRVVYFHDSESDTVQRGVIVGIEARCTEPGYSRKWNVLYTVKHAYAADPPKNNSLICEADLHDRPEYAFPDIVEQAQEAA